MLLPLLALPLAYRLLREVHRGRDAAGLDAALAGTARLLAVFSLLLALGWIL